MNQNKDMIPVMPSMPEPEEPSRIVGEAVARRTRNTKHFQTENHGGIAAVYPEAVHYEEDGVWKEIDNRLEAEDTEESGYQNKKASLKVKFAKHGDSKKLVTMQQGNKKLSWCLKEAAAKKTGTCNFRVYAQNGGEQIPPESDAVSEKEKQKNESWNQDAMKIKKNRSGGIYEEILPGLHLEYRLEGDRLKENIILASPQAAGAAITFRIQHKKLEVLVASGEIVFHEPGKPEQVFYRMAAPYMYDQAGIYCGGVSYQVETVSKEELLLHVQADQNWLFDAGRRYPVVIDPNTETIESRNNIEDTFVKERDPDSSIVRAYGSFVVANNYDYGRCRSFLKFKDLPDIPAGAVIYDARICVWQYGYSSYEDHGFYVTAHAVTSGWSAGSTTWNSQPSYDGSALDIEQMNPVVSGNTLTFTPKVFNVTKLVRDWYNKGNNNGIMLKMQDESVRAEAVFVSSDYPVGDGFGITTEMFPSGTFYYRDANGLEEYYSYHDQSVGRAGTGYVNDFNGNLVFTHQDAGNSGSRFPASLGHSYNLSNRDEWRRVGRGWRLSAHQSLTASGIADYPYVYTDGDGTSHYFYKDTQDNNRLKDEDGIGYVITATSSGNDKEYMTMETKEKRRIIFRKDGYISKEIDSNGNTIEYIYEADQWGDRVVKIKDAAGASISLNYAEDGSLESVTDEIGRITTYSYDKPKYDLISITYPDGKISRYQYNNHNLEKVTAPDGYQVEYTYVQDFKVNRVSGIKEMGGMEPGQEIKISYKNGNTTIFKEPGLDGEIGTSADNRVYTYQFDTNGRPACVCDQDGNAASYAYFKAGQKNNKLSREGTTMKTVHNYLLNTRFEEGLGRWGIYAADHSQVQVVGDMGYIGMKSVKVTRPVIEASGSGVQQNLQLHPGTYTLSAYMKVQELCGADGMMSLAVLGMKTDGSVVTIAGSPGICRATDAQIDGGWQRESVTFQVVAGYTQIAVIGAMFNGAGSGWMTCFQLEEGERANPFNLMENGNFELVDQPSDTVPSTFNGNQTNSSPWADGRIYGTSRFGSYALRLYGEGDKRKGFWKKIPLSGSEKDIFSVSGWAKGNSAPGKEFGMVIGFEYEDGTSKWDTIYFNTNVTDWQYVNQTISASDQIQDTNKRYKNILFHIFYSYNVNDAYFDGIQMIRDDGESYVYDDDGNLISAKSAADKAGFAYDKKGNISKMMDITGTSFEYGYDTKQNLTRAASSEQVCYQLEYDSMGNPTRSRAYGDRYHGAVTSGRVYYIREKVSGKYLDVTGGQVAPQTAVQLWELNGSNPQKWKAVDVGAGYLAFLPMHATSMALDVAGAADKDSAPVDIYTRNNSDAQKFKLKLMGDGSYQILAKCTKDKRALTNAANSTDNGAKITTWGTSDDYDRQRWYFEPADEELTDAPEDGSIFGIRVRRSGMYLDVQNQGTAAGTSLIQYYGNGTRAQQLRLEKAQEDYYYIRPVCAPQMALARGGKNSGYPTVTLQPFQEGAVSQQFQFVQRGNAYAIISRESGEGMEIAWEDYTPGRPVIVTGEPIEQYATSKLFILENQGKSIESGMTYTPDGRQVATITDARGYVTTNTYDEKNRLLTKVTDAKGNETSYTYDSNDRIIGISKYVNGQEVKVEYEYENDRLKAIAHNGFKYEFLYDSFGNVQEYHIGGSKVGANGYLPKNGLLDTAEYATGTQIKNEYDKNHQMVALKLGEQTIAENKYDNMGYVAEYGDLSNGTSIEYQRDLIGRPIHVKESNGRNVYTCYDAKCRVDYSVNELDGTKVKHQFIYGDVAKKQRTGFIYGIKIDDVERAVYEYDALSRITDTILKLDNGMESRNHCTFYDGAAQGTTTQLIKDYINHVGKEWEQKLSYAYDELGYIKAISENDENKVQYSYDEIGQLVREDNQWENKTILYQYDVGGNLLERKEYVYTTQEELGTVLKTDAYEYPTNGWRDQMKRYNGETITYDGIGNPLTYRNGIRLTWKMGKQLQSFVHEETRCDYDYNIYGTRIKKNVNGVSTKYYLNGNTIMTQITGSERIDFTYDAQGHLMGFKTNGQLYFYVKNLQDDIIGIIDSLGNPIVSYTYNSWGRLLEISGTQAESIGVMNPFRYRGYYYDTETGFYYLNSRYYDPVTQRYLNADNIAGEVGKIGSYNMYAYCGNNPINREDPSGHSWKKAKNFFKRIGKKVKKAVKSVKKAARKSFKVNNIRMVKNNYKATVTPSGLFTTYIKSYGTIAKPEKRAYLASVGAEYGSDDKRYAKYYLQTQSLFGVVKELGFNLNGSMEACSIIPIKQGTVGGNIGINFQTKTIFAEINITRQGSEEYSSTIGCGTEIHLEYAALVLAAVFLPELAPELVTLAPAL